MMLTMNDIKIILMPSKFYIGNYIDNIALSNIENPNIIYVMNLSSSVVHLTYLVGR
jgi:hypothetical protein